MEITVDIYHSAKTIKTKGVVEQYPDYEEW